MNISSNYRPSVRTMSSPVANNSSKNNGTQELEGNQARHAHHAHHRAHKAANASAADTTLSTQQSAQKQSQDQLDPQPYLGGSIDLQA